MGALQLAWGLVVVKEVVVLFPFPSLACHLAFTCTLHMYFDY